MSQQFEPSSSSSSSSSPEHQVQDTRLSFDLVIHALSRYKIFITHDKIEILFIMENHKDVNLTRVKNLQTLIIQKNSCHKIFSYVSNNGHETFLCSVNNLFDEQEFNRIHKILVDNILLTINMNTKISMLRRQKKKFYDNLDKIQRKELNAYIKSYEKSAHTYRKNIKAVLNGLF